MSFYDFLIFWFSCGFYYRVRKKKLLPKTDSKNYSPQNFPQFSFLATTIPIIFSIGTTVSYPQLSIQRKKWSWRIPTIIRFRSNNLQRKPNFLFCYKERYKPCYLEVYHLWRVQSNTDAWGVCRGIQYGYRGSQLAKFSFLILFFYPLSVSWFLHILTRISCFMFISLYDIHSSVLMLFLVEILRNVLR